MKKIYIFISAVFVSLNLNGQSLYFPPTMGDTWDTISPTTLGYCPPQIDSLYNFLQAENTKAFILLKDGKIVLEKYFGSFNQDSLSVWYSAAKTLVSVSIGFAQQENYLNIENKVSDYLGSGWTSATPLQEDSITIKHQISMSTGIDNNVPDIYCTLPTCLQYLAPVNTRWAYHEGPYTLTSSIIQSATGQSLNMYSKNKFRDAIGMGGVFVTNGYNLFISNARTMARFGLFMLNGGNWNGSQLLDSNYFQAMTNTSQSMNLSYGYLWWLNGKNSYMFQHQFQIPGPLNPNAPNDMICALGKDGQLINIVPSQNLVWIRMGESPQSGDVPIQLNDAIWEYVNGLQCATVGIENPEFIISYVQLFPNPSNEIINIKSDEIISNVVIIDIHGRAVKTLYPTTQNISISINDLASGLYFVNAGMTNGNVWTGKLMKK